MSIKFSQLSPGQVVGFLVSIFALACALRVVGLGHLPIHLHQDEIMNGYVGRYILQNGKDLYGNRWPILYFDNFGDYPNVIPMYISGLSTYLFGLTPFAIRFPIALIGALAVFPLYGICIRLFRHRGISLALALLLAISPWHIVLSRATSENVMATTVFLTGLYVLLRALQEERVRLLLPTFLLYAGTYLLYPSYRIIVPLSLLPTFFLTKKKNIRRLLLLETIIFFGMTLTISRTTWGRARFAQTSVFTFNNEVNNRADHYSLSADKRFFITTRLFDNKPVLYVREIIRQYLSYFSPNFLFTDGGRPHRYLVPDQGLFYISLLVILVAAYILPREKSTPRDTDNGQRLLFLYSLWIGALAPLPAALTLDEVPNVHRALLLAPALLFLVGGALLKLIKVRVGSFRPIYLLAPIICLEFLFFLQQYVAQGPAAQAYARYDERTDLITYLIANQEKYDTIIVPREIFPIYYLFYTHNFDPALAGKFQKNLYTPQIGKLQFVDDDCPALLPKEKLPPFGPNSLVVDMDRCDDEVGYQLVDIVHHRDLTSAYLLLQLAPPAHPIAPTPPNQKK